MKKHWTEKSIEDFRYRVWYEFVEQVTEQLKTLHMNQSDLARELGVTRSRVSQFMTNPGNLTLDLMIKIARALDVKVAVLLYDDGDNKNNFGPIHADIFKKCWQYFGSPNDFFELTEIKNKKGK